MRLVSPKLRKSARGESCTLRIPGVCNRDDETVVLAHLRYFSWAGMGQKPPDYLAVYACSACHQHEGARQAEAEDLLRALGETLQRHFDAGRLRVG